MKDAVTKLLDEVESILRRTNRTISDLAKDIGRSYHQTYLWVRARRFNPRADALMKIQQWRNEQISRETKASALLAPHRRGTEE